MDEKLFQQNLRLLLECNQQLKIEDIDVEGARNIKELSDLKTERKEWSKSNRKIISLPRYFPRSEKSQISYEKQIKEVKNRSSIEALIDVHTDVHLLEALLEMRTMIRNLEIDPDDDISVLKEDNYCFLAMGTGDGQFLQELMNIVNPCRLIVAVKEWEEFISSFWEIDWMKVWGSYSSNGRSIELVRYHSEDELLNIVTKRGLIGMDHCYLYLPPSIKDQYPTVLFDERLKNTINYLGYTLDEYNMIINSVNTLSLSPRVFQKPLDRLGGKYIVCGSGPSLDKNIEELRNYQKDYFIIASGSNIRTLLKYNITPDLLVLVEREKLVYDDFLELSKEYDLKNTKLMMSVTCWADLIGIFSETMIFFRPALTPLAIFADGGNEIIDFEGPESVNAALSLCLKLEADVILFCGVDLGAKVDGYDRSKEASGYTIRKWDRVEKGNYGSDINTNRMMIDVRSMLELAIRYHGKNCSIFNMSDGLKIDGAEALSKTELISKVEEGNGIIGYTNTRNVFNTWWNSCREYSKELCLVNWNARKPREHVRKLSQRLCNLIDSEEAWFPTVVEKLDEIMSINVSYAEQFPIRIMRGTVYKTALFITQQKHIAKKHPKEVIRILEKRSRELLCLTIQSLEEEIYELCDYVETINKIKGE